MKTRQLLVKKTVHMGISTVLSRILGLVREILQIRFLGVGAVSDAFNAAFMLPNTMRKIFAEGALSAALSPTLVSVLRKGNVDEASRLVTLVLASVQTILLTLCLFVSFHSELVVELMAPGFSPAVLSKTAGLASILIFFIIFISAAAVFSSALTACHKFFVPANGQVLLNLLLIGELMMCLYLKLSVAGYAYLIVANGLVLLPVYWYAYKKTGLTLVLPNADSKKEFVHVMKKFVPCLITVGSIEISLVIDRIMASYLPVGSISLLSYTSQFMRVPLGIFAIGFATVLLPHVSHVALYAPRRLWFYLLESVKLIAWVTIPLSFVMATFSYKIFSTILLSKNFTEVDVLIAGQLLAAFAGGLFFFSLNKILINLFYAHHDTVRPTIISLIGAVTNTLLNFMLMRPFGVLGIVIATCISAALQTLLFLVALHHYYKVSLHLKKCGVFILNVLLQSAIFGVALYILYNGIYHVMSLLPGAWGTFFCERFGFWLWVGPLCATLGLFMYLSRKKFGIRIYFLDHQG